MKGLMIALAPAALLAFALAAPVHAAQPVSGFVHTSAAAFDPEALQHVHHRPGHYGGPPHARSHPGYRGYKHSKRSYKRGRGHQHRHYHSYQEHHHHHYYSRPRHRSPSGSMNLHLHLPF
ncbi:hypothetical protein [Thioalkalivibrio sp. ARh3]|uniref:hypothetical protein n=1 Tax=Thioalkalivibrio sp. ARh3 TaxID=1158148 RepID=UPI00037B7DF9|nr:hypothetical protein [Thioalkalivibrio sp. ARh3]